MNRLAVLLPLSLLPGVVAAVELRAGVDVNGDGYIRTRQIDRVPVDVATAERPFIFWVNHDQDDLEDGGETWPIFRRDADTEDQDSLRDLEDFTRLRLEIEGLGDLPDDANIVLDWQDDQNQPALNVFRSAHPNCTRGYLLDVAVAQDQLNSFYAKRLAIVTDEQVALPIADLGRPDLKGAGFCFLIEPHAKGVGTLRISLSANGVTLAAANPISMDLRHVKELYQRTSMDWPAHFKKPWEYVDEQPPQPDLAWRYSPLGFDYDPPWYETDDIVVWIYGWLRSGDGQYEQATTQAGETIFKRLWHRGFRGRLVMFHWPTVKPRYAYGLLESEYRAYKCAPQLNAFVATLPPDKRVHVTAHSLGNVLMMESLRLGLQAEDALFQVAAIPAGAVDTRPVLELADMQAIPTPLTPAEGGYHGYLVEAGSNVRMYTMYNYADVTFFGWNIAQKEMKPTRKRGGYRYEYRPDAPDGQKTVLIARKGAQSVTRPVTDPHEIMAFIARLPHTRARRGSTGRRTDS